MNELIFEGFKFIYAGKFFINEVPSPKKYKWGDKDKTYAPITTCLEFSAEGLDEKKEQAYIVTVDNVVVYVGEFSGALRERWLKVENYIWHHKDHLIYEALKQNKSVLLWLIENPCIEISSGVNLNISKSIEHHILKNNNLLWNQRNN